MSRIGRLPIPLPEGVQVQVDGNVVKVQGPRGSLSRSINEEVSVSVENGRVIVQRSSDERRARAIHGLTRTLISNMIKGVTVGYSKSLELVGTGFRASKSGAKLVLSVGFSHPVEITPPEGIEFEVPNPTSIIVKGNDNELVGRVAAEIRNIKPPEPYLGKGIKYTGEVVRRKAGKAGKK